MQKGMIEEINGILIQVLDRRKNCVCLDVDIECTEGNDRGNAILKLYGPNKRKQNVITVSKSKLYKRKQTNYYEISFCSWEKSKAN